MWILGIFLLLSVVELGVLYYYWSMISDYYEVGMDVGTEAVKVAPVKYKKWVIKVANLVRPFRKLIWIPIAILTVVNWIVALLLGGLIELIISFF